MLWIIIDRKPRETRWDIEDKNQVYTEKATKDGRVDYIIRRQHIEVGPEGEEAITELNNNELRELFTLRTEALKDWKFERNIYKHVLAFVV